MRPGAEADPIVLSTTEFDVLCEAERLTDHRHVVLDVPSPGATYTERAEIVAQTWASLRSRRLAQPHRDQVDEDLGDLLVLLAGVGSWTSHPRPTRDPTRPLKSEDY